MNVKQLSDFSRESVVRFVPFLYYEDGFSYSSVTNDYFCLFIGKADEVRRKIPCCSCIWQALCFTQICLEQWGNNAWYIHMNMKLFEDPEGKRKIEKKNQVWWIGLYPFLQKCVFFYYCCFVLFCFVFQGVGSSIKYL